MCLGFLTETCFMTQRRLWQFLYLLLSGTFFAASDTKVLLLFHVHSLLHIWLFYSFISTMHYFYLYFIFNAENLKVMLLCGSDLLESFCVPGVWIPEQVYFLSRFSELPSIEKSLLASIWIFLVIDPGSKLNILFVEPHVLILMGSSIYAFLVKMNFLYIGIKKKG